ncbi:putative small auxin-up RNA [Helianthus debilis subsp. tardiflorus]
MKKFIPLHKKYEEIQRLFDKKKSNLSVPTHLPEIPVKNKRIPSIKPVKQVNLSVPIKPVKQSNLSVPTHSPETRVAVPKGKMVVYVGQEDGDYERLLVPVIYINHPLFVQFLRKAEEEYVHDHRSGITIPCRISEFENVKSTITVWPENVAVEAS